MNKIVRNDLLNRLKNETFDLLIIGGGATGSGIALDAATRGLKVALLEAQDFASGTSSRSTKLLHGGVRYLERAFKTFDFGQLRLVSEGLRERFILMRIAPHLTKVLPIVIPIYSWMNGAYYMAGMKAYELLSRKYAIGPTRFLSKEEMLSAFPAISTISLKGGVQFFDGQFDDARMNISLILTAIKYGACAVNYVEVVDFKRFKEKICAAEVRDHLTNEVFSVQSKVFINATGSLSDSIRKLDDLAQKPGITASAGTHILLDGSYVPAEKGLLIPHTDEARVLFILPWKGSTLVGTTDVSAAINKNPSPTKEEIHYLLEVLKTSLGIDINEKQIKASWAGIRPLVAEKGKKLSEVSREFKIIKSDSGLYSIIGGKWTSYRKMAETLVDELFIRKEFDGMPSCITAETFLIGAENYSQGLSNALCQEFQLEKDVSQHLAESYGTLAIEVIKFCKSVGGDHRIVEGYPYLAGEAAYAFENEMACTVEDFLYRRIRLGMLDEKAAGIAIKELETF